MRKLLLRLSGHRCPPTQHAELASARSLLRSAAKQRDHAHLLLSAVRTVTTLPESLERSINCAVALESEGDIEEAERKVAAFLKRERIEIRDA